MTGPLGMEAGAAAGVNRTYTPEEIAYVAKEYWTVLFSNDLPIAIAVAMAESGGNIYAHNAKPPDDSYGLWQINMIGSLGPARRRQYGLKDNKELYIPMINAKAAFNIYLSAGRSFRPWSTYTNGAYKKYLWAAEAAARNPKASSDVNLSGPDQTKEIIGGKLKEWIIDPIISFLTNAGLRIGGVLGGMVLIGLALWLYTKRGK